VKASESKLTLDDMIPHLPEYLAIRARERVRVVDAAETWIGTPFRLNWNQKGRGVDCLRLIGSVYIEAGLIEDDRALWPVYNLQNPQNEGRPVFTDLLAKDFIAVASPPGRSPLPGDIMLIRWPRDKTWGHSALVTDWPWCLHVLSQEKSRGVERVNADPMLRLCCAGKQPQGWQGNARFFTLKKWQENGG
jgi:cell wall-associated NlpC family hydrolase